MSDSIKFRNRCIFIADTLSCISKINIKSSIGYIDIANYIDEYYEYCKECNEIRFYIDVSKGEEDIELLNKIANKFNLMLAKENSNCEKSDYYFYINFNDLNELYIICKLIKR